MILPGPEAQQLATYIGWLMHRTWVVDCRSLFVMPSLLMLIALSWAYMRFGDLPQVHQYCMHQARCGCDCVVCRLPHWFACTKKIICIGVSQYWLL